MGNESKLINKFKAIDYANQFLMGVKCLILTLIVTVICLVSC